MIQSSTIPFIYLEQQKFRISQEAKEFLQSIKQPVGVLVIVGKYRTGKSLFLNRIMLQSKQAFKVSPTIHSCTKGLWMWKGTIKCTQQDNPTPQTTLQATKQIIVIDTEGFGATEQSDNYNNKILLFALLLSSYFVYNSVGSIDENSLNNISVLANIANEIQSKNAKQQNLESQFPSFMWLVRDFTLNLVDKNNLPISPKQYLQQSLQLQKGTSSMIESKNKIRRMVKHFFVERDCFTLVRPVETEEQLQQLDTLEEKDFRQEFVEQARRLRERILGRVKVKKLRNQMVMDGQRLLELAQNYVEVVNGGGLPNLEASYRHLVRVQANNIRKRLLRQYQTKLQLHMTQHLPSFNSYTQYHHTTHPLLQQFHTHLTTHLPTSLPPSQSTTITTQSLKHLSQLIPQLYLKYKQHLIKTYVGLVQEMKEDNLMRLEEELAGVGGREGMKGWLDGKMGEVRERVMGQVGDGKVAGFVIGEIEEEWFGKEFGEEVERRYVEIETKKMLRHNHQLQTKLYSKQQLIKQYLTRISTLQHHLQTSHTTTTTLQSHTHLLQHQLTTTQTKLLTLETTLTQQLQQLTLQNRKLNATLQQQKANMEKVKQQLCEEIKGKREECEMVGKELVVCEERLRAKEREDGRLREEVKGLRLSLTQSQSTLAHLTTQLQSLHQSKQLLSQQYITSQHSSTQLIDNLHNTITDLSGKLATSIATLTSQVRMIELLNVEMAEIKQRERLILESNMGLVNTVGRLEERLRESDSRVQQYKVYKKMFKNAGSVQCKNCDRFFLPTVFNVHLQVCTSFSQNHHPTHNPNPTNESNPTNPIPHQHSKLNYQLRKPLTQSNKPINQSLKQKKIHSPGQFFKIWEQKQSNIIKHK